METAYSLDKNGIRTDHITVTPRFSVNDDQALENGIEYLNQNGYAVFSDVMSVEEIQRKKDLLWDFLENIEDRNFRRNDPNTWSHRWPGIQSHGVINDCGIGQSDFMWSIRSHPPIKRIFSRIWNCDELLVSFDGCGIFRDWRYEPSWKTSASWYHVDQNPQKKPNKCCFQGFLSLTDQNETTGGFVVIPRSHLRFNQLVDLARHKDFIMIPKNHPVMDRGLAIGKLVQCQTGDFVVWDSRSVHWNSPSFQEMPLANNQPVELLRVVAYVSMSPVHFVQCMPLNKFRKLRKLAVQNNFTLNHWSTEIVEARSSSGLPKIPYAKLDSSQRALVMGMTDEENDWDRE